MFSSNIFRFVYGYGIVRIERRLDAPLLIITDEQKSQIFDYVTIIGTYGKKMIPFKNRRCLNYNLLT